MHRDHRNGWRPFWAALGAALLVLLPLAGGTVLLTRQAVRSRIQTAEPRSGIPVQLPKAGDRMTFLVCTAGEQPGFLLVYLNASQNCLNLLAVPGELSVPFGDGTAALARCYGAAGPARCRQALLEALPLPEDTLYLALSPALLEKLAARYGSLRVSFSGALTAGELDAAGLSAGAQTVTARELTRLFAGWDGTGVFPAEHRAAARAAAWDAFFRQDLELLPATLPEGLRANSSALLTDFSAQDYALMERVLEFLANGRALPQTAALPGLEGADGSYTLTEDSLAAVQTFLSVSPTSGNAESCREP